MRVKRENRGNSGVGKEGRQNGEVTRRRRRIEEERRVSGDECGEVIKCQSRETDETEGWVTEKLRKKGGGVERVSEGRKDEER